MIAPNIGSISNITFSIKPQSCESLSLINPTANQYTVMMESNEWSNKRRVAFTWRNSSIGSNDTIHNLRITTCCSVFAQQTLCTIGTRFKNGSPLNDAINHSAWSHPSCEKAFTFITMWDCDNYSSPNCSRYDSKLHEHMDQSQCCWLMDMSQPLHLVQWCKCRLEYHSWISL